MSDQIAPIFFSSISLVTAVPQAALGTLRDESIGSNVEKYIYVCNNGIAATGVGVGLVRVASSSAGLYSCTASSLVGDMAIGFVKHVTIPPAEYGWALKRGLVNVTIASSASSKSAAPMQMGIDGTVLTLVAGGVPVGHFTTIVVSGNAGSLYVNL